MLGRFNHSTTSPGRPQRRVLGRGARFLVGSALVGAAAGSLLFAPVTAEASGGLLGGPGGSSGAASPPTTGPRGGVPGTISPVVPTITGVASPPAAAGAPADPAP